jgi:hypothetical protein
MIVYIQMFVGTLKNKESNNTHTHTHTHTHTCFKISPPNSATICFNAGCPGLTTFLASSSMSTTNVPFDLNLFETFVFPVAILEKRGKNKK